jgi:Ca-activated chloride channel family protein
MVIIGRYRSGGDSTVSISGSVAGDIQTFRYENQIFDTHTVNLDDMVNTLPRLWATRKIGHLLNQVRLDGADQETIDQIVRLSIRYGIVTPYTAYLVTEPMPLSASQQERIAIDQLNQLQALPSAPVTGQEAVEKATRQGALAGANVADAVPSEAAQRVRIIGVRAFLNQDGVWTDTTYDPETMQAKKVEFLSADYFALARSRTDLATALALGPAVIVAIDGIAYEVVPSLEQTLSTAIPMENSSEPVNIEPMATPGLAQSPVPDPEAAPGSNLPCGNGLLLAIPLLVLLTRVRRETVKR